MVGNWLSELKQTLADFPPLVKTFLIRALLLFVIWKGLYLFFWSESRTLDDPLTLLVGKQSAQLLNFFTASGDFNSKPMVALKRFEGEIQVSQVAFVSKGTKPIMNIADECNGLELFVLYIGFIIAMPTSIKRKLIFGISGILIIHAVNLLRCIGLGLLVMHWDQYFDVAHHYIFKIMVYSTIFFLWILFSRKLQLSKVSNETV